MMMSGKRRLEKPRSVELAVKGVFRLGRCYIFRQGVPGLWASSRESTATDGWSLDWWHQKTIGACRTKWYVWVFHGYLEWILWSYHVYTRMFSTDMSVSVWYDCRLCCRVCRWRHGALSRRLCRRQWVTIGCWHLGQRRKRIGEIRRSYRRVGRRTHL